MKEGALRPSSYGLAWSDSLPSTPLPTQGDQPLTGKELGMQEAGKMTIDRPSQRETEACPPTHLPTYLPTYHRDRQTWDMSEKEE